MNQKDRAIMPNKGKRGKKMKQYTLRLTDGQGVILEELQKKYNTKNPQETIAMMIETYDRYAYGYIQLTNELDGINRAFRRYEENSKEKIDLLRSIILDATGKNLA
jgi:hypothetical protein